MAYRTAWMLVCLLVACDDQAPPRHPNQPIPPQLDPLAAARASVIAHMPQQLRDATAVRDAVVMGRLFDAKPAAHALATRWPDRVLAEWLPFVVELRAAAAEVAKADNLDAACQPTAALALACGQCHVALSAKPEYGAPVMPHPGPDAEATMRIHRWAADRLWDGIIQGRDEPWDQALAAFRELPSCADDFGGEQLTEEIDVARTRFEAALDDAAAATDLDDRALSYGTLLRSCNGCHTAGC